VKGKLCGEGGVVHLFVLIFNQLTDGDGSECRNGKILVGKEKRG
jgi:hypothetical protein